MQLKLIKIVKFVINCITLYELDDTVVLRQACCGTASLHIQVVESKLRETWA